MKATDLLKKQHRQVKGLFKQLEKTENGRGRRDLMERIAQSLKMHTQIEEEIFYPAFLEATEDKDTHHEAEIEHDGAKKLIAQIEKSSPSDDYFDSKVKVLSEMIKHHVKEEEQRGGMFAEAKSSGMDLVALGAELKARKDELSGKKSRRGSAAASMEYAIGM